MSTNNDIICPVCGAPTDTLYSGGPEDVNCGCLNSFNKKKLEFDPKISGAPITDDPYIESLKNTISVQADFISYLKAEIERLKSNPLTIPTTPTNPFTPINPANPYSPVGPAPGVWPYIYPWYGTAGESAQPNFVVGDSLPPGSVQTSVTFSPNTDQLTCGTNVSQLAVSAHIAKHAR